MAPKVEIPEGFELLVGRSRDNAKAALALAEERGFDPTAVRTSTALGGYLIPLGESAADDGEVLEAEVEEIVFPDAEKDSHAVIDEWAANFSEDLGGPITFEGIEAENPEKPTKAEKVAHLQKVVGERAEKNDADLGADGADETEGD